MRGRELTLLGKWAIFFSNYLLVKYCGISTERVGEHVGGAVYGFLLLFNLRISMSGGGKGLVIWI